MKSTVKDATGKERWQNIASRHRSLKVGSAGVGCHHGGGGSQSGESDALNAERCDVVGLGYGSFNCKEKLPLESGWMRRSSRETYS